MSAKLRALHYAVVTNNIDEARIALNVNNVNYIDPLEGLSLLAWSVTLGYYNMTELLIQKGAVISLCDRNGFQPIHRAVWTGTVEMVKLLLAHGADANALNRRNLRTPLSLAAIRGSVEIAVLLEGHISRAEASDVDARDVHGRSALDIAAASGSHHMVAHLLASGADAYFSRVCANEGAESARTWADRRSYDEINRLLCQSWAEQSQVTM
ncbi:ankyrin repeat protein, putative [Bodo saltans]|uniref:Ankyrin repeat protein, putative n=1 Tax=Bodo saltans TaxID=75058 RepID=A0A0S4IRG3_BODSA|nr:ankyrin repeat protein, putative [Bodo saltans]|eukprot:CUF06417.1 ankyrin repeat protein, putative [Bodo saltans]